MANLIELLKKNEKAFCKMSNEMQEKANEIGWSEFLRLAICFPNTWNKNQTLFSPGHTYRLRPEYEDEPEIIERKITIGGCTAWMDKLVYTDEKVLEQGICEASVDPNFNGFGFEDGSWHDQPIKPVGPDGKLWSGNITVDDIVSGRVQILHATHVLSKQKKQE